MKLLQLSSPGSMAGTARHFESRGAPSGQMSSPNMALQRTRRPRIRSGRSLRSLGSPLNARPLGAWSGHRGH